MIQMGVGEDHGRYRRGMDGQLCPVTDAEGLEPLEHPAVDEQAMMIGFEQILRAGNRAGRA